MSSTPFITANIIQGAVTLLVGLLYGAMLPMWPKRPILLGGIIAPAIWTGLLHSVLGIVNPFLADRIGQTAWQYLASFDRGLGHAMAHEVGHLLLGAHSHAPAGLMTAHWYPLETHLQTLTPEQVQVIRVRAAATEGL